MKLSGRLRGGAVAAGLGAAAVPSLDIANAASLAIFVLACVVSTYFLGRNWHAVPLSIKLAHAGVLLLCVSALVSAIIFVAAGEVPVSGVADIFGVLGYLFTTVGLSAALRARSAMARAGDVVDAFAVACLPLALIAWAGFEYFSGDAPLLDRLTVGTYFILNTAFLPLMLLLVLGSGARTAAVRWAALGGIQAVGINTAILIALSLDISGRDNIIRLFGVSFVFWAVATSHESFLDFARPGTRPQSYRWKLYIAVGIAFGAATLWQPSIPIILGSIAFFFLAAAQLRISQVTNQRLEHVVAINANLATDLADSDSVSSCLESGLQATRQLLGDPSNLVVIETSAHGKPATTGQQGKYRDRIRSNSGSTSVTTTKQAASYHKVVIEQIANVVDFAAASIEQRSRLASEAASAKAKALTLTDKVTELPNQDDFEALGSISQKVLSVFYFSDVYRLRGTEGTEASEALIRQFVERSRTQMRATDRLWRGAGPTLILLSDASDSGTQRHRETHWVETKRGRLAAPIEVASGTINPLVAAGVAEIEASMSAASALLRANMALEKANEIGGQRAVVFTPELELAVRRRWQIEAGFSKALRNPADGGFTVHYQPIVDAKTTAVVAVEALARWNHPDLGVVPPAEFIPAAERAGLVSAIDSFVLNTALTDLDTLRSIVPKLVVQVNMSAVTLTPDRIRESANAVLLGRGGSDPGIVFEVIESALGSQPLAELNDALGYARDLGIGVSIDDFGTGESNFDRLRKLPFTQIKLANEFAQSQDRLLVESMLRTASHLELDSVAEGVETLEQYEMVRDAGAQQVQGWLFAKAAPLTELVDYLLDRDIARPNPQTGARRELLLETRENVARSASAATEFSDG